MDDGLFHDAHEVYLVSADGRRWLATFRTKSMAGDYVAWLTPSFELALPGATFEVVPV